jgi:hypothetical protein
VAGSRDQVSFYTTEVEWVKIYQAATKKTMEQRRNPSTSLIREQFVGGGSSTQLMIVSTISATFIRSYGPPSFGNSKESK